NEDRAEKCHEKTSERGTRGLYCLRSFGIWRRGLARPTLAGAKDAAGGYRGRGGASVVAALAGDPVRQLGGVGSGPWRSPGSWQRRDHAEAQRFDVPGREKARRLVEMEDRSARDRCRAGVCAKRAWAAQQSL